MYCYRLIFQSPFHVDTRGTGFYEQSEHFLHSSTIYASIVSSMAMLEPDEAEDWAKNPNFLVSSAFPFYKNLFFLPRPATSMAFKLPKKKIKQRYKDSKKIKRINWLETNLWKSVVTGDTKLENIEQFDIIQEIFAILKEDSNNLNNLNNLKESKNTNNSFIIPERFWAIEEKTRLYTDRLTNQAIDGLIFHFGRIYFQPGGGLYFLARFNEDSDPLIKAKFEAALTLLGDSGIGSDRNNGNGFFKWEQDDKICPDLDEPGKGPAICLSLFNPCLKDFCDGKDCEEQECYESCEERDCKADWIQDSKYILTTNAGWIGTSGLRRESVRMFSEASCFPRKLKGRVLKVGVANEGYTVYRDARGFFVKGKG